MSDHLHPDPDERELLAAAFIDGTLTAVQRAQLDDQPELRRHAEAAADVRRTLQVIPPAPAQLLDRAVQTALRTAERRPSAGRLPAMRWVTTAAAAAVVAGIVTVTALGGRNDHDDSASRSADAVLSSADAINPATGAYETSATVAAASPPAPAGVTSTIAAINAAADAALTIDSPEQLLTLDTGLATTASRLEQPCVRAGQRWLADILYRGVPAVAVEDSATNSVLAVDAQCNELARVQQP